MRKKFVRVECARVFARNLRNAINIRVHHFYDPVSRSVVFFIYLRDDNDDDLEDKARRKSKQVVLFYCADLFY